MSDPILMTQAQYARYRNKSPQHIGKLYMAASSSCAADWWTWPSSDAVLDDRPSERTTMDSQAPAS